MLRRATSVFHLWMNGSDDVTLLAFAGLRAAHVRHVFHKVSGVRSHREYDRKYASNLLGFGP